MYELKSLLFVLDSQYHALTELTSNSVKQSQKRNDGSQILNDENN